MIMNNKLFEYTINLKIIWSLHILASQLVICFLSHSPFFADHKVQSSSGITNERFTFIDKKGIVGTCFLV